MHRTRNAAYGQPYRGFESLPLRHYNKTKHLGEVFSGIQGDFSGGIALPAIKKGASKTTSLDQAFSFATSQSLAARLKREHQRPAASVLPESDRLLAHLSELSERDCSTAQSASAKDFGLRNASR